MYVANGGTTYTDAVEVELANVALELEVHVRPSQANPVG